ncbi:hypothetical protein [Humidisolicoccus flavus]|uniref:hypothetical protein n=1 Tax=Humidisolicoccus flavus TaxID=3111414 RepID=UPI003248C77E
MPESFWGNAIFSLVPTIILGLIFWLVIRSIIHADRTQRRVYAQIEAEERERAGLPPLTKKQSKAAAQAAVSRQSSEDDDQVDEPESRA